MKSKPDKEETILEAMLDLVVERGFHNAPMAVLAKRAGVSAGLIYHYFPGKEELINALYLRIRSLKRDALLDGYSTEMSPKEVFYHVWTNAYRFYRKHLRETRFLDQYESTPFACVSGPHPKADPIQAEFQARFQSKKKGGFLKDLPPEVIQELTFGLASRLAKNSRILTRSELEKVAESVWMAISD